MGYEKHQLAIQYYEIEPPGKVQLPAGAHWVVRKHVGDSEFKGAKNKGGEICLILQHDWEPKSGHWAMMSFLSEQEALELSQQLQVAVETS